MSGEGVHFSSLLIIVDLELHLRILPLLVPNSCSGTHLRETLFRASRSGPNAKQSFASVRARTEFGHAVKMVVSG
jgi:hypothetical protein